MAILLLSSNLKGSARHLALIQVMLKVLAVVLVLPLLWLEISQGYPLSQYIIDVFQVAESGQVAALYLFLQLLSVLIYGVLAEPIYRMTLRFTPVDQLETLGRPKYLYEQALEDTDTALRLLENEQARLVKRLPSLLDNLRQREVTHTIIKPEKLHKGSLAVQQECSLFVSELFARPQSQESLEQMVNLHARNDLIANLKNATLEFSQQLDITFPEGSAQKIRHNLVEALHLILQLLADTIEDYSNEDELFLLSQDRSEVMSRIRGEFIQAEDSMSTETQTRLFATTVLFERLVWLVRRYSLLLERKA